MSNALGGIYIFEKGADNAIRARLRKREGGHMDAAQKVLDEKDPTLRSIACAFRDCTDTWHAYETQVLELAGTD